VTRSGFTGKMPAVQVQGTGSLLPGGNLGPFTGGGNYLDAVQLSVNSTADLAWVTPSARAVGSTAGMGYLLGNVTMLPGTVFTAVPGSVVKGVGRLTLDAARLTAHDMVFTSVADDSTGMPMCPSYLVQRCTRAPGGWGGIHTRDGAVVELDDVSVRYAGVALSGTGDVRVASSRFEHNAMAIHAGDEAYENEARLTVTDSSFVADGRPFYRLDRYPAVDAPVAVRAVRVQAATFVDSTVHGATVHVTSGKWAPGADCSGPLLRVERNTVVRAPSTGISVSGCRPLVRDNVVREGRSPAGHLAPSMAVAGVVTVGSGGDVSGNVGSGGVLDALMLSDTTVVGGLAWVEPRQHTAPASLGYLGHSLEVVGPGALRVRSGGDLQARELRLHGADLIVGSGARLRPLATEGTSHDPECGQPCLDIQMGGGVIQHPGFCHDCWSGAAGDLELHGVRAERTTVVVRDQGGAEIRVTDSTIGGPLSVTGAAVVQVLDSTVDGIRLERNGRTVVERNTVPWSRDEGILVVGSDGQSPVDLSVADNVIVRSAGDAVELRHLRTSVGPGRAVRGNTGREAGALLRLRGVAVDGGLTWVDPSADAGPAPLGHHADGLRVIGPGAMVVPAGSIVTGTEITLDGATLDASAPGSVFTRLGDGVVRIDPCRDLASFDEARCRAFPHPDLEIGIRPGENGEAAGGATLVDAELRGDLTVQSGASSTAGAGDVGVLVRDSSLGHLWSDGSRVRVERSVVHAGTQLTGRTGHELRDVHLHHGAGSVHAKRRRRGAARQRERLGTSSRHLRGLRRARPWHV
ncbi:MAG TPA: right-handed parallel beta-helix repeat-containing protein, partial [Mycobacteriales bacterium]|nr:right-handed parallel beta-helix repeat-containing protein [Mycobacteriales bacterium]